MDKKIVVETAKRLLHYKNEIMQRWEERVRSEFIEAKTESKPHLIDSLPQFLDLLVRILTRADFTEADREEIVRISQEHAEDRAFTTSYIIRHVISEYSLLREILFEYLEQPQQLDIVSRNIVINFVQAGQTYATCEFADILFDEERKIHTELEQKDEVFKTIFELSATGNAIIELASGRLLQVNQRFCQMIGFSMEELLQKNIRDISHPDDRDVLINKLPADLSEIEGKVWSIEKRYLQKDGTPIWCMISGALYPAKGITTPRVIATIIDITEKKQVEALKDQFINTLTHDLSTPLSVIDMSGQLLQMKPTDAVMVAKLAERILLNAKRCDSMIQDLLDTSRIRAGHSMALQIEQGDLVKIVQQAIESLTSLHGDRFIVNSPPSIKGHWSHKGI